ncbi:MAG: phenylalanine--tRNA ligase subunit beta [Chloroflexota bacterium]
MRVPLSWLRDYVDVELTPEQLAERLTLLGMEVKGIERFGSDWQNVVVGELLSVERHPRADRLSLTRVTIGEGEPLDIVCGATNIAVGQRVPVALPGAVLPGDRRIERTEKMGVVSNGMLCSGDELRLTSDADGILILRPDAPVGSALADLYGDVVLDVDVKPNRGDALSIVGLAREVAAATGAVIRWPETDPDESGLPVENRLSVDVRDSLWCPRFVGRWIDGVSVGPSPDRIQMRLQAAGMRPISNVVDASNYVMLELGKPIHIFDASAVADGRIVVRRAVTGERLETLDHVVRDLDPETLLIADERGPLGIAGVMGGASSEVGERTTEVIVESAIFDPVAIRRTGQRYALRSEASLRFEKGQEVRLARIGADRTARLIAEWAGGHVATGRVDSAPDEPGPGEVAFRPSRVNRLLGTAFSPDEQRDLLARVGIDTRVAPVDTSIVVSNGTQPLAVPAAGADVLLAVVPTWRRDIAIEADITEEIARVRGYEHVPSTVPATPMPEFRADPLQVRDAVRETLVGAGLTESVTHALISAAQEERFRWDVDAAAVDGEERAEGRPITVTNPLSSDHAVLRQSLLHGLLSTVATNVRRGRVDIAVFEVGKGYARRSDDTAAEWWRLGIALEGAFETAAWNRPRRLADVADLVGIIAAVAQRLGLARPETVSLVDEPLLHPGRATTVVARDSDTGRIAIAGRLGELHPAVLAELDVRTERILVAEVAIRGLAGGSVPVVRSVPPPRYPAVERDIAVVADRALAADRIDATIRDAAGTLLTEATLFDVYRGAPLDVDEQSLAFRLVFQAADRTLVEDEVDAAVATVVARLVSDLGVRIRS